MSSQSEVTESPEEPECYRSQYWLEKRRRFFVPEVVSASGDICDEWGPHPHGMYESTLEAKPSSNTGKSSTGLAKNAKRNSYKHVPHYLKPAHLVAKRNARERTRVQAVNSAFVKLRKHVPYEAKHKRLSKVKTLRLAIEYINHLQEILETHGQQGAGRYSGCTGKVANESPESSRARRRAKISDSRFFSFTRVVNTGTPPHSCSPAVYGLSTTYGSPTQPLPPQRACSEATRYDTGREKLKRTRAIFVLTQEGTQFRPAQTVQSVERRADTEIVGSFLTCAIL
ncbi:hypothetical protein EGW08_016111 [Elysia chlorotica]|uniref:BHLH domain-containing protein n=1 Tax=Elysia chlorotica TaxID=188477 RepID=A0A3S0ZD30_ELYCH|nr:hypothetical protein EGW08_016111 [Elysia chlorotica]